MTVRLSVPGKTFITGEYAVLAGGPALVACTQPRFELIASRDAAAEDGEVEGIPLQAPAWHWIRQRAPLLREWRLRFVDPHEGAGGLGALGAQFLMAHAFTTLLQQDWAVDQLVVADVWQDHQVLTRHKGSGADLLAQFAGGIARVEMRPLAVEAEGWPYADVAFTIVRTGRKLPTHAHLQRLERASLQALVPLAQAASDAFDTEPSGSFVDRVDEYARALRELRLQSPLTLEKLDRFAQEEWCAVAKGCGAWGADTILLLHPADAQKTVLEYCREHGHPVVATSFDLTGGLEVERETR